jgi:hypothetical protein
MIALRIVPVELADLAAAAKRRDGAGVLVPAAGSTAWMEHGEDGEGFYTVQQAVRYVSFFNGLSIAKLYSQRCVVADDSEVVAEVGYIKGQLVALMVSHFSTPDDEGDFFVPTPLLTPVLEISEMLREESV